MRFIPLFAALVFSASLRAAEPPSQPLWSLKGKTNTVYLLGSVHFLKASDSLPTAVDAAYQDAEQLVMEIDLDDLDPHAMQAAVLELGMQPEGQSLEQQLGADSYAKVSARARELGVEPMLLNKLRPWFAGLTLVQIQMMKLGLDPNSGVELRLVSRATADKKPVAGLETIREQLGIFAALPEEQQREFLMYSVEDTQRMTEELDALLAAWRRGDVQALADLMTEGFEDYPDLYRPLTVERNRKWIPGLEALLDDKDDYLVVVGALHLVGEDSVIELLEKKGHKVRQH